MEVGEQAGGGSREWEFKREKIVQWGKHERRDAWGGRERRSR